MLKCSIFLRAARSAFLCAALCMFAVHGFSQSDEQEDETPAVPEPETDRTFVFRANQHGDQFIRFSVMADFPLRPAIPQLNVGIMGNVNYMFFLSSSIALGGGISFGYNTTIGNNTFTIVPIMFKFMYQPVLRKFEFPLTLGVGGCFENYLNRTYFGLIVNPEVGAFYRLNTDWSIGIFTDVLYMPQWYTNSDYNYDAFVITAGLSARYHL